MKKILVTGGAGYIGSMLVTKLIELGHDVIVLDRLVYGGSSLEHLCFYNNFKFVEGDVRDQKLINSLLEQVEFVIPLACLVGAPLCHRNPDEAKEVNVEAISLLINSLSDNHKIIYPTTNSGYGTKSGEVLCDETTKLEPVSLYGITKVEAERLILSSGKGVSLRLATVFGGSFRTRFDLLVNDFVYKALIDKRINLYESHFKRNFVHIRDVVSTFIYIINNFSDFQGECFNLGNDALNISKLELAMLIKKFIPELEVDQSSKESDPDKRNYIVSNEKIRGRGVVASIGLEVGIEEMIKCVKLKGAKSFNYET